MSVHADVSGHRDDWRDVLDAITATWHPRAIELAVAIDIHLDHLVAILDDLVRDDEDDVELDELVAVQF